VIERERAPAQLDEIDQQIGIRRLILSGRLGP
jgi:hypothetical protein